MAKTNSDVMSLVELFKPPKSTSSKEIIADMGHYMGTISDILDTTTQFRNTSLNRMYPILIAGHALELLDRWIEESGGFGDMETPPTKHEFESIDVRIGIDR